MPLVSDDEKPTPEQLHEEFRQQAGYLLEAAKRALQQAQQAITLLEKQLARR